jgi:hypothetical protein
MKRLAKVFFGLGLGWTCLVLLLILERFERIVRIVGLKDALLMFINPVDERVWLQAAAVACPGILLIVLSVYLKNRSDKRAIRNQDSHRET